MKAFLTLLTLTTFSMAGLLNAVAFTVNDTPITLYDIDRLAQQQKMDKTQASIELFKQAIIKEVAEEKKITISKTEVSSHIQAIQAKNNMDEKTFRQSLRFQGMSYDEYFNQVYMQKLQQKLIGTLTYGKISEPTQKEKENFFYQNIKDFSLPSTIETTFFQSSNKASLAQIKRSPMFAPDDVTRVDESLDPKKVNPKIVQILLSTPLKSYTKIMKLGANQYGMFFIKSVGAMEKADFESVEKQVEMVLMSQKRSTFINNFFQDKMRQAKVTYLKIKPLDI